MNPSPVYIYRDLDNIDKGIRSFLAIIKQRLTEEKVGIKIHFGEEKNTTHINPKYLDCVTEYYKNPYYVECNVLYKGSRTTASSHIKVAKAHGFTNMPIQILDGEEGMDYFIVPINQKNIKNAKLGLGLKDFSNLISFAHFKGHLLTGFGGTIKNLGMGLGSRTGKLEMHTNSAPVVNSDKCSACGACIDNCNFDAITLDQVATIDPKLCSACARCIAVCPSSAISVTWGSSPRDVVMERIVEYALAATKDRSWAYVNFLTNMTKECDCFNITQKPITSDLALLMSFDPVAIDQASIDLITKRDGKDPFYELNSIKSQYLLNYAALIGLGSKEYNLVEIE